MDTCGILTSPPASFTIHRHEGSIYLAMLIYIFPSSARIGCDVYIQMSSEKPYAVVYGKRRRAKASTRYV